MSVSTLLVLALLVADHAGGLSAPIGSADSTLAPMIAPPANDAAPAPADVASAPRANDAAPASLASDLARADSAYFAGRDDEARAWYRVVLARDPQSVRANHRLGLLLARINQLGAALTLLGRARAVEPTDAGLLLDEARLLAWTGRLAESIADYDTLLALDPANREGTLGRARVLGWAGRFAAADTMYAAMMAADPHDVAALNARAQNDVWSGQTQVAEARYRAAVGMDSNNVEARLGLARLLRDQGRPRAADAEVSHVLNLEPDSRDAATLSRELRAAQRPQVETGFGVSQDSDHNVAASSTVSTSLALADGLRGSLALGALAATDPNRRASRTSAEAGLDFAHGVAQFTLAGGARWLDPSGSATRALPTYRSSLGVRAWRRLSTNVGYAHSPLDETAVLIGSGLEQDELQGSLDASVGAGVALSAGGGAAWLSDGNQRTSGLIALMHPLGRLGSAGVLGRVLAYDHHGIGYFSPDRFTLVEARTTLAGSRRAWTGRFNAGLGAQQIGARGASQLAWRAAGEAQYGWGTLGRVVASLGASNSAATSTTGAYRYFFTSLALRIGI